MYKRYCKKKSYYIMVSDPFSPCLLRASALCPMDKEAVRPSHMWFRSDWSQEPQHVCPFAPSDAQKRGPGWAFHQQTRARKP